MNKFDKAQADAGSSPRVRGTRHREPDGQRPIRGSSPRVRGTRAPSNGWPSGSTVHPRVCGELAESAVGFYLDNGSSPRVRGTRQSDSVYLSLYRFIPACAGNSRQKFTSAWTLPVHPRVCGELGGLDAQAYPPIGSSPRVRGTRVRGALGRGERRFIPACAGNSRPCAAPISPKTVHPRVCGELLSASSRASALSGSSPRVRGTPSHQPRPHGHRRFIPACAGNSATCPARAA